MAMNHMYIHKKLLRAALLALISFHGLRVAGALEEVVTFAEQLHGGLRSSFYLVGYCSTSKSPECTSLTSLLESSEALTRDGLVKTGLLVYDADYWPIRLNNSIATQLWFACHDGQQARIIPISSIYTDQADITPHDAPSGSTSARAASTSASAACSSDVPFYACPQLPPVFKLELLMGSLAAAMKQHGAACIEGQMHNWHPAAAATNLGPTIMVPGAAAAAAADSKQMAEALLQSLNAFLEQRIQSENELVWRILFVLLASLGPPGFCSYLHTKDQYHTRSVSKAYRLTVIGATVAVAAATKLGTDMFIRLLGWTGTSSWLWAVAAWVATYIAVSCWFHEHDRKYRKYLEEARWEQHLAKAKAAAAAPAPAVLSGASTGTQTGIQQGHQCV